MSDYVPSIADLRVKLCYICRDEEHYDQPENPPRVWIHPCRCALIAHEACLLDWIQSSQTRSEVAAKNATKCPQCGTPYQIESRNPLILRLLSWGNRQMPKLGVACLAIGFVGLVASVTAGIYITCTSYGAYAIKVFFGQDVYEYVLTDDPNNWPLMAYIQLPIIPLNLILSQLSNYSPFLHMISHTLQMTAPNFRLPSTLWPPPPQFTSMLLIPLTASLYRVVFHRFSQHILGTLDPTEYQDDMRFFVNAEPEPEGGAPAAPVEPAPAAPNNRIAWVTLEIKSPSRLGRHIASALLIPSIASKMGSLLLKLSKHVPLLRQFLGVRPHWRSSPISLPQYWLNREGNKAIFKLIFRAFWGGISPWAELDPVWWRNTLGYGIFALARDCLQLLFRWLVKRERESRRIKDRPFSEVDVSSLDLITYT
ncbi:hypothetical protein CPB85DRAFT_1335662 [Mucidula mucida]|nr:hypothetical protein CPB85DRAFT_1335662 [Mucidula mucida]